MLQNPNVVPAHAEHGFMSEFFSSIKTSVVATIALTVVVSGVYPAVVWAIGQALFGHNANGSLIGKDGQPALKASDAVASTLIGQGFSAPQYFHPRPSAAGGGYDATSSGGSNLGPTSAKLIYGTTKLSAYTIFASDKSKAPVTPVSGRVQGVVAEVTKTSITVMVGTAKTAYALDPSVADPNTAVNFHGRTIHTTTLSSGSIVELKLNDKTPPAVTAINVVDQEVDGVPATVDSSANKITLSDSAGTVINVDPKNTLFVVNGKAGAALTDVTPDLAVHAVAALVEDNDGVADRIIHYCQDNKIEYKSSVADSAFMDADGLDDVKLITAFKAASAPSITPATPIPADAVTASGSGLDPHISVANALLQAQRVADARKMTVDKVKALIKQSTDAPSLGLLGDAGVNVVKLNLSLDR